MLRVNSIHLFRSVADIIILHNSANIYIRAKPGWQVAIHYEDEALCLLEQSNPSKERPHHIAMINKSEVSHTVIIGPMNVPILYVCN